MTRDLEWEARLFEQSRCCALNPWATPGDLKLLDVLVKERTSGDGITVVRVGNMKSAGHWNPDRDYQERVSIGLEEFKAAQETEEGDDFQKGLLPRINLDVSSSSSFLSKILGAGFAQANAQLQMEKAVKCEIKNASYEKVEQDFLTSLVGTDPPAWKPDVGRLKKFGWFKDRWSGKRDLWIVTELLYCTQITIGANWSRAVEGDLHVSGEGSGVVPPVGAQLKVSQTRTGSWEVTGPTVNRRVQRFAFAFRGIRLQYDESGETLVHLGDSVGKKRLERRGAVPSVDPFNPELDPAYHMGSLFDQSSDEVQRGNPNRLLPIVMNTITGFESMEPLVVSDEASDVRHVIHRST